MHWFQVQAQFDASELITQREAVSQKINEELATRSSSFGLLLDDISLVSIPKSLVLAQQIAVFLNPTGLLVMSN